MCSGYSAQNEKEYLSDFTKEEKFSLYNHFDTTRILDEEDFLDKHLKDAVALHAHSIMRALPVDDIFNFSCFLALADKDGEECQMTLGHKFGEIRIFMSYRNSLDNNVVMRKLLKARDKSNGIFVDYPPAFTTVLIAMFAKYARGIEREENNRGVVVEIEPQHRISLYEMIVSYSEV